MKNKIDTVIETGSKTMETASNITGFVGNIKTILLCVVFLCIFGTGGCMYYKINKKIDYVKETPTRVKDSVVGAAGSVKDGVVDGFTSAKDGTAEAFTNSKEKISSATSNAYDKVTDKTSQVSEDIGCGYENLKGRLFDKFKSEKHDEQ